MITIFSLSYFYILTHEKLSAKIYNSILNYKIMTKKMKIKENKRYYYEPVSVLSRRGHVKIPNVCEHYGVRNIKFVDFLREAKISV